VRPAARSTSTRAAEPLNNARIGRLGLAVLALAAFAAGCSMGGPGSPPPPPTPTAKPSPNAGGLVNVPVPTPAPILCSPSPVTIVVNQRIALACAAAKYIGPMTAIVADPTIASATLASTSPLSSPLYFWVTGLKSGTTTLTLTYGAKGNGSVTIDVSP
jgi:hypothetical protein